MIRFKLIGVPLLAVAIELAPALAHAQSSVPLNGALIRPSADTFLVSYGGQPIGTSIQRTESVSEAGTRAWKQSYAFHSPDGSVSTDTLLVDASSLRSIREARVNNLGRFAFRFGQTSVEITVVRANATPTVTTVHLARPAFSSAALDIVVRALPLAPALRAEMAVYYPPPSTKGAVRVAIRVLREETLVRGGVQRIAHVVVVGEEGEATTYWIDKETRALLQFDTQEGAALIQFRR